MGVPDIYSQVTTQEITSSDLSDKVVEIESLRDELEGEFPELAYAVDVILDCIPKSKEDWEDNQRSGLFEQSLSLVHSKLNEKRNPSPIGVDSNIPLKPIDSTHPPTMAEKLHGNVLFWADLVKIADSDGQSLSFVISIAEQLMSFIPDNSTKWDMNTLKFVEESAWAIFPFLYEENTMNAREMAIFIDKKITTFDQKGSGSFRNFLEMAEEPEETRPETKKGKKRGKSRKRAKALKEAMKKCLPK